MFAVVDHVFVVMLVVLIGAHVVDELVVCLLNEGRKMFIGRINIVDFGAGK